MQPGIQLAFWAVSAHCQIIPNLPLTNIPKYFSIGLLSIYSSTSINTCIDTEVCPGLAARYCTFPCWISWCSYGTSLTMFLWMSFFHPEYQEHHSAGVACKVAEHSIPLSVLLIKLLNSISSSTGSWGMSPITVFPLGHWAIDYYSFFASIEPIFYPTNGPSTKPVFSCYNNKNVMGHHIKRLREVWVDGIQALPLVTDLVIPSQKVIGLIKHDLYLVMPGRLSLITFLSYTYFDIYFKMIPSMTCFTIPSMTTEEFLTSSLYVWHFTFRLLEI